MSRVQSIRHLRCPGLKRRLNSPITIAIFIGKVGGGGGGGGGHGGGGGGGDEEEDEDI